MKFIVYRTSAGGPYPPFDDTPYPPPCDGTQVMELRHRDYPYGRPLMCNVVHFNDMIDFTVWAAKQGCPVVLRTDDMFVEPGFKTVIPVLEIRDQRE